MQKYLALFGFALVCGFSGIAQTDGDLDLSFNTTGIQVLSPGAVHDNVNAIAELSDGKIILAGLTIMSGWNFDIMFARLNEDGTLDTDFGTDGYFSHDFNGESDFIYDMKVLPSGKILACGAFSVTAPNTDILLVRLNPDGTLDDTFGNAAGYSTYGVDLGEDYAKGLLVTDEGKIVIVGSTGVPGFTYTRGLLMGFTEDGILDESFGDNGKVVINVNDNFDVLDGVASDEDGNIYACGYSDFDFQQHSWVTKYSSSGVIDAGFGVDGNIVSEPLYSAFFDIVVDEDRLLMCGNYSGGTSGIVLKAMDFNGVADISFDGDGIVTFDLNPLDDATDMLVQGDGKILVCGATGNDIFSRDVLTVRFNSDGSVDETFAVDGVFQENIGSFFDVANSVALQSDGKILVGGIAASTNNDLLVIRLLNGPGIGVNETDSSYSLTVFPNPTSNECTVSLDGQDVEILQVYDCLGRPRNFSLATQRSSSMDTSSWDNGFYQIKVQAQDGQIHVLSLVVQH